MAIAHDASTNGGGATGTSLTFAHVCTGSNLLLFVDVAINSASDLVTGVTYNSVAMTQIDKTAITDGWLYMFYLLAPATGSNNVVISASSSTFIAGASSSYTGALQSGVPDAFGKNTAVPGTSVTKAITTIADNCWVHTGFSERAGSNNALSAGTGVTQRVGNGATQQIYSGDSNGVITPAGSYSMTWNDAANVNIAMIMASFAPFVTLLPSVSDNINVSESTSATLTAKLSINIFDSLTVSESVTMLKYIFSAILSFNLSDSIIVSEQVGIHRVRYSWSANWSNATENSTNWKVTP